MINDIQFSGFIFCTYFHGYLITPYFFVVNKFRIILSNSKINEPSQHVCVCVYVATQLLAQTIYC